MTLTECKKDIQSTGDSFSLLSFVHDTRRYSYLVYHAQPFKKISEKSRVTRISFQGADASRGYTHMLK